MTDRDPEETQRRVRVVTEADELYQAFYRVKLTPSRVGWHCASGAVPSQEYAVRHALLDAERHRLHNMQAELEIEYRGESSLSGYPCGLIEYAIVRLRRTAFWCCRDPKDMGRVVERFGVDLAHDEPRYDIAIPLEETE